MDKETKTKNNDQIKSVSSGFEKKHPSYKAIKKIGQGSFGKAYLVESDHDHKKYIMKKIRIDSQSKSAIFQQVKLMQALSHLYIIKYIESFIQDKYVCLVMDYAENGDLEKYLEKRKIENKPLKEDQIISWFIQLCLGLKYIHQRKILHRDLKADNIFITDDYQLKIGDFGVSKVMTETYDLAKTKIGTPHIMAPQIFQNMKYNQKSDIWSLGCVLYKLQTLRYPFQSTSTYFYQADILAMMAKMQNKKYQPIQGQYSEELKQLTYSLLAFQPKQRPTVHKILQSVFVKKYLPQVLENSINKYSKTQQNGLAASKKLCESNGTSSLRRMSNRKSIGSLSNSILTPLRKKNDQSLTSILQPHQSPNIPSYTMDGNNKKQNLKMIEYKQNYPILLQENKLIKKQNKKMSEEKQNFEKQTQKMLDKVTDNIDKLSKDEIVEQFRSHVLNFLYK